MAKINIEEVEAVIADQKAKREQALAQANFHTGCLMTWEELLKRLQEPDETEQEPVKAEAAVQASAGNGAANVRQMPATKAAKGKAAEAGQ